MKIIQTLRLLSLAGLGSLLAVTAVHAQNESYYYGGAGVGQSRSRIDEYRISNRLLSEGASQTSMTKTEHDTAYKVFGGYQLNRNFGVEAGYFNLGQFAFQSSTVPLGSYAGQIKLQGVNLDLVGTLPLSERWSALARVGVQYASARDSFSSTGSVRIPNASPSKNSANYKLGLGVQYEVNPSMAVRAEAERYRINDAVGNRGDINMFSVSLVFPFGRTPAPVARVVAAPVYVAPVPVPAPVAVVVVTPPVVPAPAPRRVSFSADSLFTFDKAIVRPEGRAALDTFASELKGTTYERIKVEGHTDRLGSNSYNQKLSEQRAESVKSYLISTGGVDASKISTLGKGESEPVTQPDDCKGNRATPKLIACLQPDRSVVVEVSGTRQ
jgi:OOP family OmpA-OmpF porin